MKLHFKVIAVVAFVLMQFSSLAQVNKDSLASILENKRFVFIPYSASPMRGKNIPLTTGFDFQMRSDSISCYLPYYGRSSMAPLPTDKGGIAVDTKNFQYSIESGKRSRKNISIKLQDERNFNTFNFIVYPNGDATLTVNSNYSDPISFYGIVLALNTQKSEE